MARPRVAITALLAILVGTACMPASVSPPHPSLSASPPGTTSSPTPFPSPTPTFAIVCQQGASWERSCNELARLAAGATRGLGHRVVKVAVSPHSFPCGMPFRSPFDPPGCEPDDGGPIAYVALDGTRHVVALQFPVDGTRPIVAGLAIPNGEIADLVAPIDPTLAVPSPLPPQPEYPGPPALRLANGTQHEPSMQGGCGAVAYEAEYVASDQCAGTTFDRAIAADAIRVRRGETLSLLPPSGWRIGSDPALDLSWRSPRLSSSQAKTRCARRSRQASVGRWSEGRRPGG